ncbi:hypothetical protein Q0812_01845 [Brevundimonas sp. 2R-24]|uniref:DUF4870 domain-containing protein n=1 Tax=Peiella sedimenti TaxID=3061083 RepID=A0ABT8SLM5_9CAUL|nr:hypothetical protein [Caulobacteraceae bacterium XZ-24]
MTHEPSRNDLLDGAEERPLATVVWLLYLLAIPSVNVLAVVGVILAYTQRNRATGWVRTHLDAQVALFWKCLIWMIALTILIALSAIFSVILIGIPFLIVFAIAWVILHVYFTVVSLLGLLRIVQGRAA